MRQDLSLAQSASKCSSNVTHSLIAYRQVARWHVDALLRGGNDRLEPRHNPQVGQGYSGAQLEIRD